MNNMLSANISVSGAICA